MWKIFLKLKHFNKYWNGTTGHGTTDWFQIGKGLCQGCKLSLCLFNLYAECIIQNAGLDDSQVESRLLKQYQQPQICRWYHSTGRKWRESKEPLDESERVKKADLNKTQHSKN